MFIINILNLCENNITKIENLPGKLCSLNLENNRISKISNLPKGLCHVCKFLFQKIKS